MSVSFKNHYFVVTYNNKELGYFKSLSALLRYIEVMQKYGGIA